MKKLFIGLITLIISLPINAQIKNGIVEYKKVKISKRFTEKNKKKLSKERLKKFSEIEDKMIEIQKKTIFTLSFNKSKSLFEAQKVLKNDDYKFSLGAIGPDASGAFYNSNEERVRSLHAYGQDFLIKGEKYNWLIQNDTKKIGEYLCAKAIIIKKFMTKNGERTTNIIAWFTPEINIPFGPIGYSGLPGLILELNANNYIYYTTKIKLNLKEEMSIKKPIKGISVSEEEFKNIGKKTMSDFRKNRG
jgi:GLPGLI family protein